MDQKSIGNMVQALHGFRVIDRDWLFAQVSAGHHHRIDFSAGEQQVMQRRVRQKNAQKTIARRHTAGHAGFRLAGQQHNRPLSREQLLPRQFIQRAEALHTLYTPHHDRERLFHPPFSLAQQIHSRFVLRIAGQVKSAQSFHRDNLAFLQQPRCFANRFGNIPLLARGRKQSHLRTAIPAGIRLSVKPAISGIVVLRLARRARFKSRH